MPWEYHVNCLSDHGIKDGIKKRKNGKVRAVKENENWDDFEVWTDRLLNNWHVSK